MSARAHLVFRLLALLLLLVAAAWPRSSETRAQRLARKAPSASARR